MIQRNKAKAWPSGWKFKNHTREPLVCCGVPWWSGAWTLVFAREPWWSGARAAVFAREPWRTVFHQERTTLLLLKQRPATAHVQKQRLTPRTAAAQVQKQRFTPWTTSAHVENQRFTPRATTVHVQNSGSRPCPQRLTCKKPAAHAPGPPRLTCKRQSITPHVPVQQSQGQANRAGNSKSHP